MTAIDWETIVPPWLYTALPLGLFVTDTDLAIRYWCPWLERHSGLASAALIGSPLLERFPQLAERGLDTHFRQALAGTAVELIEGEHGYLLPFPPGKHEQFSHMQQRASVRPLRHEGEIIGTLCTISDQTEQAASVWQMQQRVRESELLASHQAEAAAQRFAEARERVRLFEAAERSRAMAEEALRMRDAFFSIAAHELRTPLTTLLGRAQLLQKWLERGEGSGERNLRTIGIVVGQARRLNRMITSLLDVSRIQGGRFSIAPYPISLSDLVRRVVDEWRPVSSNHTLLLQDVTEPLLINGDELRLEQVLQSLLSNAITYSPAGGTVRITLGRRGDEACVSITDPGIGIPSEDQGELFRRFYRADNADAQGLGGLGIGLYVANEILELHGGRIGVKSAESQGSTFVVHLPLLAVESAATPAP